MTLEKPRPPMAELVTLRHRLEACDGVLSQWAAIAGVSLAADLPGTRAAPRAPRLLRLLATVMTPLGLEYAGYRLHTRWERWRGQWYTAESTLAALRAEVRGVLAAIEAACASSTHAPASAKEADVVLAQYRSVAGGLLSVYDAFAAAEGHPDLHAHLNASGAETAFSRLIRFCAQGTLTLAINRWRDAARVVYAAAGAAPARDQSSQAG